MNRKVKRILSLLLVTVMIISSVPMMSFASNWQCDFTGVHAYAWTVTVPATCQSKGLETYACTRSGCDATNGTREIGLANHTETIVPGREATCDTDGNTAGKVCAVCETVLLACQTIPAKGHVAVAFAAENATCTTNGKTAGKKCSVCGDILEGGTVIASAGHDYKLTNYKAGSCTTQGEERYECRTCGDIKTTILEAEHNYGAWSTVKAPSCKEAGLMERTCRSCTAKETKAVDKLAHTEIAVTAKEATCTEAGVSAGKKCYVCEAILEGCVVIPAKGHTEVVVPGSPAACGVKGKTDASYCSVCNATIKDQKELAALEHIMVTDVANSKAANCTTEGVKAEKCSRTGCTYTKVEVLPKTHNVDWTVNTVATCTTDGKRSGYCTACKQTIVETIPAKGHTVTNAASWVTKSPATCTKDGSKQATCSTCGGTATQVIPATGHTEVVNKPAQAPTCQAVGYTESKHCTVCKAVTVQSTEVPKIDHTYGEWTVTKTATCAAAGIEKSICTACNKEQIRTIDRLKHTEKTIDAVVATCTTAGSTEGIDCTVCGAKVKEVEVIPALGHDYVEDATVTKTPTCTENGAYKGVCSRCKEVKEEVIPALGHTEEIIPGTAPDCTQSGISEGKKCTVCGNITVEQATVPALGHDPKTDETKSTAATCTTDGLDYRVCARENCTYHEEKVIVAPGHTYDSDYVQVQAPGCVTEGIERRTCTVCKENDDKKIAPSGNHNVVSLPGVEATCTEPGKTSGAHCEDCGTVFGDPQEEIPALGHDVDEDEKELTKATMSKDGMLAAHCKRCNEPYNPEIIPQIDETSITLSTTKYTYNGEAKNPTVTVKDREGNVLVEDVEYEVTKSSGRKAVGKYTYTIKFIGNYSGEKKLTFTIAPGKTDKLSAASTETKNVKITWNAVEGATGYNVYVYKSSDSTTSKKVKSVSGTSYSLGADYNDKTLKIGSEYKIAVEAYAKLEDGTVIKALNKVDKTFTRMPGKPTSLTLAAKSGAKVDLNWTNVDGESGFEVWCATEKDGSYKKVKTTEGNVVKYTYTLKATEVGKTYYFKVRAFKTIDDEKIYGSFSDIKSVKISMFVGKPTLTVAAKSGAKVALSWTNADGETGFQVYYATAKDGTYKKLATTEKNVIKYTHTFKASEVGKTYYFKVRAYRIVDGKTYYGSYSDVKSAKISMLVGKPTVTVTAKSTGKVDLSWTNVDGETGFQVYYATTKDGTYKKLATTKANVIKYSYTFAKSNVGKTLYFKVRAYKTVDGKTYYGSYSEIKSVKIK